MDQKAVAHRPSIIISILYHRFDESIFVKLALDELDQPGVFNFPPVRALTHLPTLRNYYEYPTITVFDRMCTAPPGEMCGLFDKLLKPLDLPHKYVPVLMLVWQAQEQVELPGQSLARPA